MLMKMKPVVNLTYILQAGLAQNYLYPKTKKPHCEHSKASKNSFCKKRCLYNVGDIVVLDQFHQHFTHTHFFVQKSFEQLFYA